VLAVALAVRFVLSSYMTVLHADEVWQYLEPAYGLVTGSWVRAWEFHDGLRGWLVPVMLVPPIALGHAIAPDSSLHLYLVRGMLSILSLGIVLAWYDLARPIGRGHALIAAWVAATWCEVFYFAVRPSAEAIGMALLFPAMALAARLYIRPDRRQSLLLGLLLALGFVVRFHYLPAIGLIALWSLGPVRSWRHGLPPLLLGFAAGIALGGLCDLATGHAPLVWIWRSIAFNVVAGGSAMFGTQPPWWLAQYQIETWSWAALAIVPLIVWGAWRRPMLLAIAVAVYAAHSLIAHKEYRFVILGTATLLLLAAIGSAELCAWLRRRPAIARRMPGQVVTLVALGLGWAGLSLVVARAPIFLDYWQQGDDAFSTLVEAGEQPGICGVALYEQPAHPALAMSMFNRKVPALLFDGEESADEARAMVGRYNVAIASLSHGAELPAAFHLVDCIRQETWPVADRDQCVFVRPGGCRGAAGDFTYQPAMERRGK
jgi:hypothetical protein